MRIAGVGRYLFAAMLFALGVLGLNKGEFAAIWQPVSKALPGRVLLAYLCAVVSLFSGIGLLRPRFAALAARVLLGYLLLWMLLFRVPALFRSFASQDSWSNAGETAVIIAGAWVLSAAFATDSNDHYLDLARRERGLRIARVWYGLALFPFGIGHFTYLKETAGLVPNWLPGHVAWAYMTGCAYLAAGIGILFNVLPRMAAALCAAQMAAFTVLVWFPMVAAGSQNAFVWSETLISMTLTAAGWVLADSYRGMPWLHERSAVTSTGEE